MMRIVTLIEYKISTNLLSVLEILRRQRFPLMDAGKGMWEPIRIGVYFVM